MNIVLQIKSLVFSFIFGFIFSMFTSLFYKLIYSKKNIIQLLTSLLLIIAGVLVYFFMLKGINNAVFHIYELISILIGYFLELIVSKKIFFKDNK